MSNIGTTVERFNGQTTISLTGDKTHISFILSSFSLSESVGRLYDNYEGLLDQFALFWGEVARTFAGSKTWNFSLSHRWIHLNFTDEHVLGYEIMNEPWCGDVYEDPTLLVPGVADRRYLQPMYEVVL